MTNRRWLATALLMGGLGAVALLGPTRADEAKPKSEAAWRADLVKMLATAHEVAEFGRKTRSPEALVTAGGLLLKVNALLEGKGLEKLEAAPEDENGKKLDEPPVKQRTLEEQADELFGEAENLADAANLKPGAVVALVKAAKARKYADDTEARGAESGPRSSTHEIRAGGFQMYHIPFKGGEPAVITFSSDRPCRFRIVSPTQGELQDSIVRESTYSWRPARDITIKIEVRNAALQNARYEISHN